MRTVSKTKRREPSLAKSPRGAPKRAPSWLRGFPTRGVILSGLFVGALAAFGAVGWHAVNSGLVTRVVASTEAGIVDLTKKSGLEIRDVMVVGRDRTKRDELLRAIGTQAGDPILTMDLEKVHARVAALAWVKEARLERRLPDTVFVSLVEREPMALWQRGGKLHVIDLDGGVIPDRDVSKFANLPIVIGDEAPKRAREVLAMLALEPDLGGRVRAITWVSERRWDVRVDDQINVQLPEQDPHQAWAQLAKMEREHGVLRRDVITIDMRLRDQLVVRVAPAAAARKRDRGRDT